MPDAYAFKHPGGRKLLENAKISDCPGLLFLSYHMASDLDGKVAAVAKAMNVAVPKRGKMYDQMHAAVRKVKADHPEQHRYFLAYCLFLSVVLPVLFFWWMAQPGWLLGVATATAFELYFLNVFHTRHHRDGLLYESRILNQLLSPMYDFIDSTWGYFPHAWGYNHNVKHHMHTNDTGIDTDVPSMYPMVRSCHDTPRLWFHKFQTFYWPLLVVGAAVNFPVNNMFVHKGKTSSFVWWITFVFLLPVLLHGWHALGQSLFLNAWAGASLAYKFAVSHAHEDLTSSTNSKESYAHVDEWLRTQVQESMSWGGYWSTFIFGGLNMQIEHHLCPCLDPPLYALVAPEIAKICRSHGIEYVSEPSLFHAMWQFHKKLWSLGSASGAQSPAHVFLLGASEPMIQ